jgi:hypothetical protein
VLRDIDAFDDIMAGFDDETLYQPSPDPDRPFAIDFWALMLFKSAIVFAALVVVASLISGVVYGATSFWALNLALSCGGLFFFSWRKMVVFSLCFAFFFGASSLPHLLVASWLWLIKAFVVCFFGVVVVNVYLNRETMFWKPPRAILNPLDPPLVKVLHEKYGVNERGNGKKKFGRGKNRKRR